MLNKLQINYPQLNFLFLIKEINSIYIVEEFKKLMNIPNLLEVQ